MASPSRNPCRTCKTAWISNGKHIPNMFEHCEFMCEQRAAHERWLEQKRQYRPSEPLISILEFQLYCQQNKYVFWRGRLQHVEVIRSLQYRIVQRLLESGLICSAIKTENSNG